jgi:hypothetical protein
MSALRGLVRFLRQHALVTLKWLSCGRKHSVDAGSSPVGRALVPAKPPTHYVIIRADLPLGVLAAQLVHAAGESVVSPVAANTHAAVLAARDEVHLASLETQLLERGLEHRAIREPDRDNELMAIGIPPLTDRTTIKPVTGKLRPLGETRRKNCTP